jgi:hypothetical protein
MRNVETMADHAPAVVKAAESFPDAAHKVEGFQKMNQPGVAEQTEMEVLIIFRSANSACLRCTIFFA